MSTTLELVTRTEWWTGSTGLGFVGMAPPGYGYIVHWMRWRVKRQATGAGRGGPRRGGSVEICAEVTPSHVHGIWSGSATV